MEKVHKQIWQVIGDPHNWNDLTAYLESRIQFHKDQMVVRNKTLDDLRAHQGAVSELQYLLGLRDYINGLKNN